MTTKKRIPRLEGRRRRSGLSYRDIANEAGTSHTMVHRVCMRIVGPYPASKALVKKIRAVIEAAIKKDTNHD